MTGRALLDPVTSALHNAFTGLVHQPADGLLGLIALHRADLRSEKIDLGVGVFRNDAGATPVMRAVKKAEEILVVSQDTKSYLGADGDLAYTDLLAEIALGSTLARSERVVGVQTPGGTGALRLGAELLARARPQASVWMGDPTWPNHAPIFADAGLTVRSHRFYDVATATIEFDAMMDDLAQAVPGDILLLHGCCHNPTGATFSAGEWKTIARFCADKGLIAFIDLAYQGLGDGLDKDAQATRMLFEALPAVILAYSCDKNFGLYRERVGALWIQAPGAQAAATVHGNMLSLARSLWSMPPDHGAAVVRTILERPELRADWMRELDEMRQRITMLRETVAAQDPRLGFIARQRGMFAMLPVSGKAVTAMRRDHGIYMAGNGRINIAGLTARNVPLFVAGLTAHIRSASRGLPMTDTSNPLGLNGFEFVEFTSPDPDAMAAQFEQLGFVPTHRHPTKNVTRYKQGRINLMLNRDDAGRVAAFRGEHGPSASAMAFRVANPEAAMAWALEHGGKRTDEDDTVIQGIGGSYLYFIQDGHDLYGDWTAIDGWQQAEAENNVGLDLLDHLTHNVRRGQMRVWSEFYRTLFNFQEQKYFDIKGQATGLFSQAMIAPDKAIRIPLNESQDDKSQIEEFIRQYHGEGIQHLALTTGNIYDTVERLRARGVKLQDTIETYYELVDKRVPGHGEDVERLKKNRILIDGSIENEEGILLQIFTENMFGPIFFEIIQRKGNEGFGNGNFQALFESIELDQIRRGVITVDD